VWKRWALHAGDSESRAILRKLIAGRITVAPMAEGGAIVASETPWADFPPAARGNGRSRGEP